jgi:hypothetical protein
VLPKKVAGNVIMLNILKVYVKKKFLSIPPLIFQKNFNESQYYSNQNEKAGKKKH